MKAKIVGIHNGANKDKLPFTKVSLLLQFNAYDQSQGAVGNKVKEAYIKGVHVDTKALGKECILEVEEGYQGKLEVVGIQVL